MLTRFNNPSAATQWCVQQRQQQQSIGFVPTMGALHAGHLSLVEAAGRANDRVCVSIFVNPLQFNNADDLKKYPRDLEADCKLLQSRGCDMVFSGSLNQFFPSAQDISDVKLLDPGRFAQGLEGEHRPGHFAGVRTIVARLFEAVGPCRAYFGAKDFQQSLVVCDLATHFDQLEVIVCPTVREQSGLALSSRNAQLSKQNLDQAKVIHQALLAAQRSWQSGQRSAQKLSVVMRSVLNSVDLNIEYASVRDPNCWTAAEPIASLQTARAFIAVQLGGVRLIDNLSLDDS